MNRKVNIEAGRFEIRAGGGLLIALLVALATLLTGSIPAFAADYTIAKPNYTADEHELIQSGRYGQGYRAQRLPKNTAEAKAMGFYTEQMRWNTAGSQQNQFMWVRDIEIVPQGEKPSVSTSKYYVMQDQDFVDPDTAPKISAPTRMSLGFSANPTYRFTTESERWEYLPKMNEVAEAVIFRGSSYNGVKDNGYYYCINPNAYDPPYRVTHFLQSTRYSPQTNFQYLPELPYILQVLMSQTGMFAAGAEKEPNWELFYRIVKADWELYTNDQIDKVDNKEASLLDPRLTRGEVTAMVRRIMGIDGEGEIEDGEIILAQNDLKDNHNADPKKTWKAVSDISSGYQSAMLLGVEYAFGHYTQGFPIYRLHNVQGQKGGLFQNTFPERTNIMRATARLLIAYTQAARKKGLLDQQLTNKPLQIQVASVTDENGNPITETSTVVEEGGERTSGARAAGEATNSTSGAASTVASTYRSSNDVEGSADALADRSATDVASNVEVVSESTTDTGTKRIVELTISNANGANSFDLLVPHDAKDKVTVLYPEITTKTGQTKYTFNSLFSQGSDPTETKTLKLEFEKDVLEQNVDLQIIKHATQSLLGASYMPVTAYTKDTASGHWIVHQYVTADKDSRGRDQAHAGMSYGQQIVRFDPKEDKVPYTLRLRTSRLKDQPSLYTTVKATVPSARTGNGEDGSAFGESSADSEHGEGGDSDNAAGGDSSGGTASGTSEDGAFTSDGVTISANKQDNTPATLELNEKTTVKVVDTVYYDNFTPNQEYRLTGSLLDVTDVKTSTDNANSDGDASSSTESTTVSEGEEESAGDGDANAATSSDPSIPVGAKVIAETSVVVRAANESGNFEMDFGNVELEPNHTYVVFEKATEYPFEGITITHEDPQDPAQTIVVTPKKPEEPEDPEPNDPEDPTNPNDPDEEDPNKPVTPTDPNKPTEPDKPVTPTDPKDPDKPTDPENPTNPEEPKDPKDPEEPTNPPTNPEDPKDPPTTPTTPVTPTTPEKPEEEDPNKPVTPTDPNKPTEPDKPVTPTDPKDPDKPTDPDKPMDPTDPTKPTDPENPSDPEDPTDPKTPTDPTDPDKPVDPDNPDEPDQPTDPDNPSDPDKPIEPDKPVDPESPNKPKLPELPTLPSTGSSVVLLGGVAMAALLGGFAMEFSRKRRCKHSK